MRDQRGRGDVQRQIAPVWVGGGLGQRADPLDVGRLGVAGRLVTVEEGGQRASGESASARGDANRPAWAGGQGLRTTFSQLSFLCLKM